MAGDVVVITGGGSGIGEAIAAAFARQKALLAGTRGRLVIGGGLDEASRGLEPTVLRDVPADDPLLQEEIFGPILPVFSYEKLEEAINYVNDHPRPLALYYFDNDQRRIDKVLRETVSGGVTVNDVIYHALAEDLPFGGVGHSGMGAYHGHDGFKTFSHAKAVYRQPRIDLAALAGIKPPYTAKTLKTLKREIGF